MGQSQVGVAPARDALATGPSDSQGGDVLLLRRPGLWLPAYVAMYALAGAALTAGVSNALPALAEPLRIASWVALVGAAAAGALAWVRRRPTRRFVLQADGFWMPPDERTSGSVWIPYRDVRAVHPWNAWRLRERRQLVLALRGRIPRFWSARSFVDPDALERLVESVRGGVGRLPDGAERLRELDRRAASAAVAQRGWPVVTLAIALLLAVVYLLEVWSRALQPDSRLLHALAAGPETLEEGQLFRWVTASLLHSGEWHLAGNLLWLLLLGALCERLVGRRRFLILLLGGALGGAVLSSVLDGSPAIGASAATSGAMACLVYLMAAYRDEVPGILYLPLWECVLLVALLVGVEAFRPGDIDHVAHAGGFVTGLALAAVLLRGGPLATLARRSSRLATSLTVGLLAIFAGGIAWGLLAVDWAALR